MSGPYSAELKSRRPLGLKNYLVEIMNRQTQRKTSTNKMNLFKTAGGRWVHTVSNRSNWRSIWEAYVQQ